MTITTKTRQSFLVHGAALFFIGLLSGAGFSAEPCKESVVESLLRVSSVAAIAAAVIVLSAFYGARR